MGGAGVNRCVAIPARPDGDVECAAMGANDDGSIHSVGALCAVATRGEPTLRAWALRWLRGARGDEPRRVIVENLSHESDAVRRAAAEALTSVPLDEGLTAALRALAEAHPGADGDVALTRLIEGGDEQTLDAVLARVAAGEVPGEGVVEAFLAKHPARLAEALRVVMRREGFTPSRAWASALTRVATEEDLGWFLSDLDAELRPMARYAAASVSWVAPFSTGEKSTREWTHLLDVVRALDDAAWEPADEASQRLRRAAHAYLSPDPWRKALSAFRSRQWWHVMEEAALIWGRFSPGPRAPSPPSFAETFGLLSRTRAPAEADAHLALGLALGAVARAALGPLDPTRDELPRVVRWMLAFGPDCLATLLPPFAERWLALAPDDPACDAVSSILCRALLTEPSNRSSCAQAILLMLPQACVDVATVLALPPFEKDRAQLLCQLLVMRPALLRECAEATLAEPRRTFNRPLLLSLMACEERWASELILRAFERAVGPDVTTMLQAIRSQAAPRALGVIAATLEPDVPAAAAVAAFLSRVMELSSPPEELVVRAVASPLAVAVRCNRCGARSSQEVCGATVHPDPAACLREGWDGIVFERVVRCACGAEDDYTLSPEQRFVLLAAWHAPDLFECEVKLFRGVCEVSEGRVARRRSEHIAALRAHVAEHPDDSPAWERLGDSLREAGERDGAVAAWRRAMEASADNLTVIIGYHEMLRDEGDFAGADALMAPALAAWPQALAGLDEPAEKARWLVEALRKMQSRSGAPLTLVHEYKAREGFAPPPVAVGGVTLEGKVSDAHRTAALLDPRLAKLELVVDLKGEVPSLAAHLEGGAFGAKPPRATQKAPAHPEGARLGRNDPCHCGSGQKFKKCHGR